jgi:hypothetical protein
MLALVQERKRMTLNQSRARSTDDIIRAYNLTMLQVPADWSIENGDLALMPDGDPQVGNLPYSALNRLAELWRYNEPHLHDLYRTVSEMTARYRESNREFDRIGGLHIRPSTYNPWEGFDDFAQAFREASDERGMAHFGAHTYAGCLLIVLSNMLQRFRSDIGMPEAWKAAEPIFNGFSVGRIVVAAANGYRHEDEWAKATVLDGQQKRSHDIITGALAGRPASDEPTPARCVEIVQLLSGEEFDILAGNVLGFAHNVAVAEDTRLKGAT